MQAVHSAELADAASLEGSLRKQIAMLIQSQEEKDASHKTEVRVRILRAGVLRVGVGVRVDAG